MLLIAFLTVMLMPAVALIASAGRGYLSPLGWPSHHGLRPDRGRDGLGRMVPLGRARLLSKFSGPQSGPLDCTAI